MSSERRSHVRVVVVTWNPDFTRFVQTLAALVQQTQGVVVVDNGSAQQSLVRGHAEKHAHLEFIGLSENMGIGTALNVGVRAALLAQPDWILTMDQDTLVREGALDEILTSYSLMSEKERMSVGIVAMRSPPQSSYNVVVRYSDRLMTTGDLGTFVQRRAVISSGNLVRADVARRLSYNEELFIDQVDYEFCDRVRRAGFDIILEKGASMDHVLGEMSGTTTKDHPYENAQRMYYIARNSMYLALRRRMWLRFYLVQMVIFCGAYVSKNGMRSIGRCLRVVARGSVDGVVGRLGQRTYP